MIGLGGKQNLPNSPYEPYQCCPATAKKGTKIPKVTSIKDNKKPKAAKEPEPKKLPASKAQTKISSNVIEKPVKGKKGLFGSGKYIWWW